MRIYVPVTLDELDAATVDQRAARWDVAPRAAHAVTTALRDAYPEEDEEGLEYAAALEAADDSLALVAGRLDVPPLRAVVTLEVPDAAVEQSSPAGVPDAAGDQGDADAPAPSAVRVTTSVAGVAIVCVHVDEPVAAQDVRAVLAAVDEQDDAALDAAIDRVTDRDLLWYDWTEVAAIPR
ncbi:hypothetical protein [Cellulomonas sp. PhB143]|uniref:DUF6912 family protein n=1 Tax=Cellulomonas sp. PhB143 TaxID=2485186 RepID=UPI000F48AC83|nr:hypothetical protein [Cellulomonas sp. PhB143]ROS78505.1 hypothetical protein EDF32_0402 [Cellulomonas sp. PhB143]